MRGLVIRTDFANQAAWDDFIVKLRDAEAEGVKDLQSAMTNGEQENDGSESSSEEDDAEGDAAMSGPSAADSIFVVIDQPSLASLSNLSLLRLFHDVSIVPTSPPPGTSRLTRSQQHRLVDQGGYVEIYDGPTVWVWDADSAVDGTVRLVNNRPGMYGVATADSWRCRTSHMWELQLNMDNGMKVDFGGRDGWSAEERRRNMNEEME